MMAMQNVKEHNQSIKYLKTIKKTLCTQKQNKLSEEEDEEEEEER